jgi:ketosteroid isomerase-like protein/GNAT superfamily N-acetyltransferase
MSTADRAARVRKAFEEMSTGNLALFLGLMAPTVTYTVIGDTRFSGRFHGMDAFIETIATPLFLAMESPLTFEVHAVVADTHAVAVEAQGHSRLRSGAAYNNTYCWVLHFEGEQAVAVTEYLDTTLVTRAFGVPDDRQHLLRSMDLNMWEMFRHIARSAQGGEVLERREFWMALMAHGGPFHNMVMVCERVEVDTLLTAIREFYGRRERAFSICVRDHADAALELALRQRGFTDYSNMPGMVLLSSPEAFSAPTDLEIRAVSDDQGRRDFGNVTADAYATYGAPREYAEDAFTHFESVSAPHVQGYVGYANGTPAAAAAVYVTHGVAGIGWVGTRPDYRGRGFGEAVTWAAIHEGFRRGASFANLQASPMGRAIYERMGFVTMTDYRVLISSE